MRKLLLVPAAAILLGAAGNTSAATTEQVFTCIRGGAGTHQGNNLWRCRCVIWAPNGKLCFRWEPWRETIRGRD